MSRRPAWRSLALRPFAVSALLFVLPAGQAAAADPAEDDDAVVLPTVTVSEQGADSPYESLVSIGKDTRSLREIPQSASVITRERLDDQNIVSLADILKYTTGVTVQRFDGAGLFNNYYVRGYQIDSIQHDGLPFGAVGNVTDLDPAIYERIEILRGPAGLFQGAGEPSATLNLVRKRAPRELLMHGATTVASWDGYRAEVDGGTPLTGDGGLRVRGVVSYEDRDSYQDVVYARRKLGYGTLEYDLGPATSLSFGVTRQEIDSVINQGLPAYATGELIDVPRSTFIGADWNELDSDTTDVFAELEHRHADGGHTKLALRTLDRNMLYKVARANGAVDTSGNTAIQTGLYTWDRDYLSTDLYTNQPLRFAGREHNLILGADWRKQEEVALSSPFTNTATMNVFDPDHAIPEPEFVINSKTESETTQYGTYGQLRLNVLDPLTLVAGGRVSWWESQVGKEAGEPTPFFALIYKPLSLVSLYASYSNIFQPQNATTADGVPLEPRTGKSYETGAKAELLDGRLQTQFAVFRLEDENRAFADPDPQAPPGSSVASGKVRSQGFETEVVGALLRNWNLSFGYTYLDTEYLKAAAALEGQVYSTFTPRHTAQLWTRYELTQGALRGLSVGGGVRALSEFYAQSGTVRFEADAYTLLSAQLGYRFDQHWNGNLVVNNLLDEKYYEKVSGAGRQNFYGEPINFSVAVRARF